MKKGALKSFRLVLLPLLVMVGLATFAEAQSALLEIRQQGAQEVVIKMDRRARYEVFSVKNPPRLFVYLYGSQIKANRMEIKGVGKYIRYVKIHPFGGNYGTVRVEVGVAEGLEHRDWAVDNDIYLWVGKSSQAPPPPVPPSETAPPPPAEVATPEEKPQTPPKITGRTIVLATKYVTRPGISAKASKLLDIVVTAGDDVTRVVINTDGPVGAFDDFPLLRPQRLVLDFFGMKADYVKTRLEVASSAVRAVRWGPHPDRTRIVMDLAVTGGPTPYYTIKKAQSGIEVLVYSKKTMADAPASDFKNYTVSAGENLRDIARKVYGDSRAWRRIVSFNRDKFANPEEVLNTQGLLYPQAGTVLKLPVR